MGPAALRIAGIDTILAGLGHSVADEGDLKPLPARDLANHPEGQQSADRRRHHPRAGRSGASRRPRRQFPADPRRRSCLVHGLASPAWPAMPPNRSRPLFVLWLDAHADFNSPATSPSGNMHGMPVAFFCGEAEFAPILDKDRPLVDPKNVFQVGIRSVDDREREEIAEHGVNVYDMRAIDETGMAHIMHEIIATIKAANGMLHVSLDVDFLDPELAPGVGTTVPGGATFREAHLIMEMLCDSGLVSSLDLVELNPFLDDRGKSARILVELTASLFGRRILDRPTRSA